MDKVGLSEKEEDATTTQKEEDLLKYRPNPDMLVSKTNPTPEVSEKFEELSLHFWICFACEQNNQKLLILVLDFVLLRR